MPNEPLGGDRGRLKERRARELVVDRFAGKVPVRIEVLGVGEMLPGVVPGEAPDGRHPLPTEEGEAAEPDKHERAERRPTLGLDPTHGVDYRLAPAGAALR